MLPGVSTISFEQFMGVSNLNFRITNNTSLSIESVALIDFVLKPNTEKIKFPFFITSESVKDPIFGYNLLEYLVAATNDPKLFDTLMSAFPHILSEGTETVASIIKKGVEVPDLLGDVKVIKRRIIPSNSIVKVKSKTNIEFETEEKSVIFQPLIEPQVDETLELKESYETIRRGRTSHVSIYITNPSNRKIVLNRGDNLGTLHNISAVIPLPISKDIDTYEISQDVHTDKKN